MARSLWLSRGLQEGPAVPNSSLAKNERQKLRFPDLHVATVQADSHQGECRVTAEGDPVPSRRATPRSPHTPAACRPPPPWAALSDLTSVPHSAASGPGPRSGCRHDTRLQPARVHTSSTSQRPAPPAPPQLAHPGAPRGHSRLPGLVGVRPWLCARVPCKLPEARDGALRGLCPLAVPRVDRCSADTCLLTDLSHGAVC